MKLSDISKKANDTMPDPLTSRLDTAEKLQFTDPKQAYDIAYAMCREVSEYEYPEIYLRALYLKCRSAWLMGKFEDAHFGATELLEKAIARNDIGYQAEAYNVLGNVNLHMDNLDQALEHYRDGLKLAKISHNSRAESSLNNNIGEIYNRLNAHPQAKEYYEKALRIAMSTHQSNGIGIAYLNLGELAMKDGHYDDAMKRVNDALHVFTKDHDKVGEAHVLYLKADILLGKGDLDGAEELYDAAEKIETETGDQYNLLRTGIAYTKLLIKKKDYVKAEKKCLYTLELSEAMNSSSLIAQSLSLVAKIYELQGDFEKALTFYKRYHDMDIQSQKENLEERLNHIKTQFRIENTQQEKEIFRLKTVELNSKNKELQQLYDTIGIISEIGRDITSTLDLEEVFNKIYDNFNTLMDASYLGISLYDKKTKIVSYPMFISDGERQNFEDTSIDDVNSLSAWCIRNKKDIFINDYLNEYRQYKEDPMEQRHGTLAQSILFVPLIAEGKIIGSVTAQSADRGAYTSHHLDMLKTLAAYTAIAIRNGQESDQLELEIHQRKEAQRELETLNRQLSEMSYMDALTKIPNRRHFVDALNRELHRSIRESEPLSVILIDLDKFKEYNDNYGHTAGDTCLESVARILENSLKRKTDFVARYGGDEFVAVLPNTDLEGAKLVAQDMRTNVELAEIEHKYSTVSPLVSITLGIASSIPTEEMTLERIVQLADQALYTAKDMGRNCIASNITPLSSEKH